LDVSAVFDIEASHLLALRSSLVGFELHAQNLGSQAFDVINALGHFDAAAFATATGVDLRLDHPNWAAEFLRSLNRLLHCEGRDAAWHGHTKLTQDVLALVFVNFHEDSLSIRQR
jgi:hypothetical protein